MSSLTANAWSVQTIEKLRNIENECAEIDLFCVGYLFPLVELVEVEYESAEEDASQWSQWFKAYVDNCIAVDKIEGSDAQKISQIVQQLE